jgi:beta-galactosidase
MSKENQEKLVNYLKTGGKIIFVGDLPIYNLVGKKETYLIDYLKISPIKKYVDWNDHLLTLTSPLKLYGQSEFRSFIAQSIKTDESALYTHLITGEKIGIKAEQYVWITSNYPGHLMYTKDILEHLSIRPKLDTSNQKGLLLTFKQAYEKTSLYHLINLEHFKQSIKLIENGKDIFDNHLIDINSNEALMLWTDLQINDEVFIYSTAEIQSFTKNSYTININDKRVYLKIKTNRKLVVSLDLDVSYKQGIYDITIHKNINQFTLYFE